jgi:hypothetical protein
MQCNHLILILLTPWKKSTRRQIETTGLSSCLYVRLAHDLLKQERPVEDLELTLYDDLHAFPITLKKISKLSLRYTWVLGYIGENVEALMTDADPRQTS